MNAYGMATAFSNVLSLARLVGSGMTVTYDLMVYDFALSASNVEFVSGRSMPRKSAIS
jgi:hypothetical protein